jgi:hypothetical protein
LEMAEWCIHTSRSQQEYLDSPGYVRDAFVRVANKYRKKGEPI